MPSNQRLQEKSNFNLRSSMPKSSEIQIGMWAELTAQKTRYLKNTVFIDEDIKKMTELLPKRGSVFHPILVLYTRLLSNGAGTFLHQTHFHTSSGAMLYLPLSSLSYYKILQLYSR